MGARLSFWPHERSDTKSMRRILDGPASSLSSKPSPTGASWRLVYRTSTDITLYTYYGRLVAAAAG
jgi:hypothetical protein